MRFLLGSADYGAGRAGKSNRQADERTAPLQKNEEIQIFELDAGCEVELPPDGRRARIGIFIAVPDLKGGMVMKKLWPRLSVLLIVAAPFITLSCDSVTAPKSGLNIMVTVSQQAVGSKAFRISVENTGLRTERLSFSTSQFFDIEVYNRSGKLVWRFSNHRYFLQVCWDLELASGESSRAYEHVWDHTGDNEKRLPPGLYKAKIYITGTPSDEGLTTVIDLPI